jgi:rubrerythrin
MKLLIFILTLTCISIEAMAKDFYVYICPAPLCGYTVIKRNPGSMNCPSCMRKKQDYRFMHGNKLEETK